ncbi:hypothetical protein A3A68_00205 [Candidatus Saccharibacteria bacterium RIFCSPLOWO2_01_FULL_48_13]|nr:MAG: hypothetical protein A2884_01970 [Candidatus Saccharibacteria bacterium RIFCSPHIGHO2_01_FULL_48_12]OGL37000.1 MAG: hypothetical protein A3A68_00205 [Candidatus Saccharibacteria bacterium RIFCSPLOWO2_01_FULL_48_13]
MPSAELFTEKARLLTFQTTGAKSNDELDVYNITAPFSLGTEHYIAGRTEKHDDGASSQTRFYRHNQDNNTWVQDETMPVLGLEDPFVTRIDNKWVIGGVKARPKDDDSGEKNYITHIYVVENPKSIDPATEPTIIGPPGMKDIRVLQLQNSNILVATRPQGKKGGLGKMGAAVVGKISELERGVLQDAPIIEGLFSDEEEEWGGANELYELDDGTIGVLGHIARFDSDHNREYYAMTCRLDFEELTVWDEKIIASSDFWPRHKYKRPDLEKVLFPGGMIIKDRLAELYGGVGDACPAEAQDIPNPFWPALPISRGL